MKLLILCVDRDDDLGSKAAIRGPVIGRKDVLKAGLSLILKDPSETDANAIFAGIKLYDELKDEKEVAIVTGARNVGYRSDLEIKKQVEGVLKKFRADGAIIVSDGKEDEAVIPAIESLVPVVSVHRVSVHSGEELKGMYYTLLGFFRRASETPEMAKFVFGVPALVALTYAFLGAQGWRVLAGLLGILLLIKGFNMERPAGRFAGYLKQSFINLTTSFFVYLTSLVLIIIAVVKSTGITGAGPLETAALITVKTGSLYYYGVLAALLGLAIDSLPDRKRAFGFLSIGVGFGVLFLVLRGVSSWILDPTYPLSYIVTTTVLGMVVATLVKLSSKFIK